MNTIFISGVVKGAPEEKATSKGKAYIQFKLEYPDGQFTKFCKCSAWGYTSESARGLAEGMTVAVSGKAGVHAYMPSKPDQRGETKPRGYLDIMVNSIELISGGSFNASAVVPGVMSKQPSATPPPKASEFAPINDDVPF